MSFCIPHSPTGTHGGYIQGKLYINSVNIFVVIVTLASHEHEELSWYCWYYVIITIPLLYTHAVSEGNHQNTMPVSSNDKFFHDNEVNQIFVPHSC